MLLDRFVMQKLRRGKLGLPGCQVARLPGRFHLATSQLGNPAT
jgi:hypothetical protein